MQNYKSDKVVLYKPLFEYITLNSERKRIVKKGKVGTDQWVDRLYSAKTV